LAFAETGIDEVSWFLEILWMMPNGHFIVSKEMLERPIRNKAFFRLYPDGK
jgi:hypothetical protein